MQNFARYPDANVNIFLKGWDFKFDLLFRLNLYNRYWNQVNTKHEILFSISLVSEQKQAGEEMQFIAVEVFIYPFTLFIFNYKVLFIWVKERACFKNSKTSLLLQHFWCLVLLLIKKLILGSKTICTSMKKFPCAVWSVRTFPYMDKEETFLSWKQHIGMVSFC